ncbi:MAG: YceD family protein [Actinomycetota bacterium]
MYIRVSEIPGGGLDVFASRGKASLPRVLEGMDPSPLRELRLVDADLLLTVEGGDIWIEGSFDARGEGFCDRCSNPVSLRFGKAFQTILTPKSRDRAVGSTVELHEEDLDVGYYDGTGVETNDILWEQVALELPLKVVCSEACRGICPVCGTNRNLESCSCVAEGAPGPFEILKNLKGKKE